MKTHIRSLTSLRFFAAFAIVLHHARGVVFPSDFLVGVPLAAGVSFFFVLSGFILAYVYADSMMSVGLSRFFVSRFSRIWPAHMTAFFLVLILLPSSSWTHGAENPWLVGVLNVALLHSLVPVPAYYFSFNAVSWSISTEMLFYLFFPLLVASLRDTWFVKLVLLLVVGFVCVWLVDFFDVNYYSSAKLTVFSGHGVAYIGAAARIQEFYIGVLFYLLYEFLLKRGVLWGRWAGTCVEVVAIGSLVFLPSVVAVLYKFSGPGNSAVSEYLSHLVAGFWFGCIVLCFSLNSGFLSIFLSKKWFFVLGETSFSIYLLHQIIFTYYFSRRGLFESMPSMVLFCVLLVVTFVLAYIVWRFVERPANTALKSLFFAPETLPKSS